MERVASFTKGALTLRSLLVVKDLGDSHSLKAVHTAAARLALLVYCSNDLVPLVDPGTVLTAIFDRALGEGRNEVLMAEGGDGRPVGSAETLGGDVAVAAVDLE